MVLVEREIDIGGNILLTYLSGGPIIFITLLI